jgi:predicted transcriptional regulator
MSYVEVHKVFVDEKSARILLTTLYHPRSALEICRASGVPVAEAFARLKVLEKKGLIHPVSHRVTLEGKEVPLYQSMFHNAYVFIDNGKLKARFQLVSFGQAEFSVDTEALL